METHSYTVHIEVAEEGGYVATVPALPGCHTQGETLEDTVGNITEAVEGYLESIVQNGKQIPVESKPVSGIMLRVSVSAPMKQ